jgi:hypothetical protein
LQLCDTNEILSDQTCTNQAIEGARRKLEQEMQTLNVRLVIKLRILATAHGWNIIFTNVISISS